MDPEILLWWRRLTTYLPTAGEGLYLFLLLPWRALWWGLESEGKIVYSTDRYQLGTSIQVLELEMIHSGAFFDCHKVVFLGTAPNSGTISRKWKPINLCKEVSGWLFKQGRCPKSDVSELVHCDWCLCVRCTQVTTSAKPDAISLVWGCSFSFSLTVGHVIKVNVGILLPNVCSS